jgi:abequosyltransferase
MESVMSASVPSSLKLSICITTFNRGPYIAATLDSIMPQIDDHCEVVILDGGSTDDTERVVTEYTHRYERLRYIRQATNNGFDRDLERAVELARGEYCWLTSDDDLLSQAS